MVVKANSEDLCELNVELTMVSAILRSMTEDGITFSTKCFPKASEKLDKLVRSMSEISSRLLRYDNTGEILDANDI